MSAQNLGTFPLGSLPTFTFQFKQNGTLTNPGVAPVLNLSVNGATKTAQTLASISAGTYTWTPSLVVAGQYVGTIYAPPGAGECAQPFYFAVTADANYP